MIEQSRPVEAVNQLLIHSREFNEIMARLVRMEASIKERVGHLEAGMKTDSGTALIRGDLWGDHKPLYAI